MYSTHSHIKASWKYKSIFTQIWQKNNNNPRAETLLITCPQSRRYFKKVLKLSKK